MISGRNRDLIKKFPSNNDIEKINISYGIANDAPSYTYTSCKKIAQIYDIVDISEWVDNTYVEGASPEEYINVYSGKFRWIIGIRECDDSTVMFDISVLKNDKPVYTGGHYYVLPNKKYTDFINSLKEITISDN